MFVFFLVFFVIFSCHTSTGGGTSGGPVDHPSIVCMSIVSMQSMIASGNGEAKKGREHISLHTHPASLPLLYPAHYFYMEQVEGGGWRVFFYY
uniref:Putative secreted protein n=1 Tax=Anopheles marajoara TaxID=58244 RepID=A0A2M4C9R8_9DIPT